MVDNLERALAAAGAEEGHLAEGVRLVYPELVAVLRRAGVESYEPEGEAFDPDWHEAMLTPARATPGVCSRCWRRAIG